VILSLLATAALAQEGKVWRAYETGASPLHRSDNVESYAVVAPPFGLIGLGQPSATRNSDELWATGERTPDGLGSIAPGILTALLPNLDILTARDSLMIQGTAADHGTVARTIDLLRSQALVAIEVRHLTLPRELDAEGRRLLADALAGKANAAALRKLDPTGGWSGGTIYAVAGSWMPYESTRRFKYLADYDVEIAQAAAVPDPIPATAVEGLRAAVLAHPLTDGRMVIRLMTSAGRLDPRIARLSLKARDLPDTLSIRDTNYGSVELATYRGCCSSTSFLTRNGQTHAILLGSPDDRTERQDLLLLTPRITRPAADETTLAMLPTGALTTPILGWTLHLDGGGQPAWMPDDKSQARFDDATTPLSPFIDTAEHGTVIETDYAGGGLIVQAKKPVIQSMRSILASLEQSILHPVRIELEIVVDRDGKRTRIGAISQPALTGDRTSFGAYRTMDYIGDHDVEVAQEARISDPIHLIATAGLIGNAQVWRVGKGHRMALDLSITALEEPETIEHDTAGVSPLQRVPQTVRRSKAFLDFPDGKAREVDLGANPFGDRQGRLIAVVRVR